MVAFLWGLNYKRYWIVGKGKRSFDEELAIFCPEVVMI
jgi:hypothetical protein